MKFATLSTNDRDQRSVAREIETQQGWWVRFGSELLVYAADKKFDSAISRISARARNSVKNDGAVKKGDMHLVMQKGRTFQLENPEIRIILDKGRYLVVEMPKAKARKLSKRNDPCFHIEPLRENTTVFDTVAREDTPAPPDQAVINVVSGVQLSNYEANLAHLVSFPTRFSTSTHFQSAAEWAAGRFAELGMTSSIVPINVPGVGASANIVARKAGSGTGERKNILIVGHMDSVNQQGGAAANAPGADDNASGSAGVLTMASALAVAQFSHDLTFILFGGEEQGLHGSIQYLASLSESEKAGIHAVLNMDMIGSVNASPPAVLLESAPASQWMIDKLAGSAAAHTALEVQVSLNPFASDHVPFLDAGMSAVLTIEGADSANDAIHTENDTIDRIDTAFATEILRMNLGLAGIVAQPEAGCGCVNTGLDAGNIEKLNILVGHYQNLFSQYSRLNRDGLMDNNDYSNWQLARNSHDVFATSAGLPKATDN